MIGQKALYINVTTVRTLILDLQSDIPRKIVFRLVLYKCLFTEGCFSLLFIAHFHSINSSSIPYNGVFISDQIKKAEDAPEDPVALGTVKKQAYLWQMHLLEAGGDTA